MKELGFDAVVAVNRFPADSEVELEAVVALALEHGAFGAAVNDGYERGGAGASALAELVVEAAGRDAQARFVYELDDPIETKLAALARRVYGGTGVELSPAARATLERLPAELHRLPVCVAKTHMSLSHDPELAGAPARLRAPGPGAAPLHRSRLDRGRLRRHPDDARAARQLRGREDGPRLRGTHRRPHLGGAQAEDAGDCEERDHDVAGDAPLADRVDQEQLRDEQIRREKGSGDGGHGAR